MEDLKDKYAITKQMVKMAKKYDRKKKWKSNTTKNQKVVTLATKVNNLHRCVQSAESKSKNNNRTRPTAPRNTPRNASRSIKTTLQKIKPSDLWCVTKKANSITHDSVKYE